MMCVTIYGPLAGHIEVLHSQASNGHFQLTGCLELPIEHRHYFLGEYHSFTRVFVNSGGKMKQTFKENG